MASYKQTVEDIKDYISLEISAIEHLLENKGIHPDNRTALIAEKSALKDIADIIKENGK